MFLAAMIGALGGMLIGILVVTIYSRGALESAHWTTGGDRSEALTGTMMFFVLPLYGLAVGTGVATAVRTLVPWWRSLELAPATEARRFVSQCLSHTFAATWLLAVYLALAGLGSYSLLESRIQQIQMSGEPREQYGTATAAQNESRHAFITAQRREIDHLSSEVRKRLTGEVISLYCGGLGLVCGLFVGLFLIRNGITIRLE